MLTVIESRPTECQSPSRHAELPARRTRRLVALTGALLLAGLVIACDGTVPSRPNADFTGVWETTVTFPTGGTAFFTVTFVQTGTVVEGTFTDPTGVATGDILGSVFGDTLTAAFTQNPPCEGDFTGRITLTGLDAFDGTYSGTGCSGPVEATLSGTRL